MYMRVGDVNRGIQVQTWERGSSGTGQHHVHIQARPTLGNGKGYRARIVIAAYTILNLSKTLRGPPAPCNRSFPSRILGAKW